MNRRISLALVLVFGLLMMPISVKAQSAQERENKVCDLRSQRYQQVQEAFSEKQEVLSQRAASAATAVDIRRGEIDEVVAQTQQEYDERYRAWYDEYLQRVSDESRRTAATTFYEQLKQLVGTRQQAQAQARQVYRASIDQIRQQRFTAAKDQAQTFKTSSQNAFESLASSCNSGRRNNLEARTEFIKSLRDARLNYAEARRENVSYKDRIQAAIQTRTDANEQARKDFEQGFQQALSTLRNIDPEI